MKKILKIIFMKRAILENEEESFKHFIVVNEDNFDSSYNADCLAFSVC